MDTINIVIAYESKDYEKELNQFFHRDKKYHIVTTTTIDTKTLDKLEYKTPDVLIFTVTSITAEVIELIERIYITKQGCAIIVIVRELDVEQMSSALEAGANKVLTTPLDDKQLANSVLLCTNREKSRLNTVQTGEQSSYLSKVISVFGTKGGVGKTTLAVNLAVSLAKKRKKVALLDFDLQFGDVGIFLDIDKTDTIAELVQDNNSLDMNAIRGFMSIHATGISVLLAPKSPEYAELVKNSHVEKIINNLKPYFDYIILDMPPSFNDISLISIEQSSAVLFVTNLDISSLKNTRVGFDIISSLGFIEKVKLVVNKDGISSIKTKDAKKILDKDIYCVIANDNKIAVNALNTGINI